MVSRMFLGLLLPPGADPGDSTPHLGESAPRRLLYENNLRPAPISEWHRNYEN